MGKLIFTALMLFMSMTGISQPKNFIDQPYIEVSGTADTLVTPNEIFISIILSERDSRDKASIEELELKMVAVLKELNIDMENALTTSDMTSNFKYYFLKGKGVLKTKSYLLKVTDANTASKVFIGLENIGISNTAIDRVSHSETNSLHNLVRANAMNNAKQRAVALTSTLNQTVGAAIHIADLDNPGHQLQGRVAGVQIRGASSIKNDHQDLPKIEFEKIKISANISAKFILK